MNLLDEAKRQNGRSRACQKCKFSKACPPDVWDVCHRAFIEGFLKGNKHKGLCHEDMQFLIKTWSLNISYGGKLIYAVESSRGGVRLLSNEHSGYACIGYLSDLSDSEQESIKNLIIEKFKSYGYK